MPSTIHVIEFPADGGQKELLTKIFASPEYSLLRQIVASKCIKAQVDAMNAGLYEVDSEKAVEDVKRYTQQAAQYNKALDVLDDIGKNEQEWFTVKLEPSR